MPSRTSSPYLLLFSVMEAKKASAVLAPTAKILGSKAAVPYKNRSVLIKRKTPITGGIRRSMHGMILEDLRFQVLIREPAFIMLTKNSIRDRKKCKITTVGKFS